MVIKHRLKILMAENNINSVSELSRETKLPYGTLLNFYHQRFNVFNADLIAALCTYFKCEITDLIVLERTA